MKKLKDIYSFSCYFFVLIAFDQFTKYEARTRIKFRKNYCINKRCAGACFSKKYRSRMGHITGKTILLLAIACIIFALLIYVLIKIPDNKKFMPSG